MATRQNSSNGKQKSPRIQVVLPEDLCERLSELAEKESRTVSNMAKVLIQEGVKHYELKENSSSKEYKSLIAWFGPLLFSSIFTRISPNTFVI